MPCIFCSIHRTAQLNLMSDKMPDPKTASYGSWPSPITSDMIVASSIGLGEILIDGSDLYWLESRPQEGGAR